MYIYTRELFNSITVHYYYCFLSSLCPKFKCLTSSFEWTINSSHVSSTAWYVLHIFVADFHAHNLISFMIRWFNPCAEYKKVLEIRKAWVFATYSWLLLFSRLQNFWPILSVFRKLFFECYSVPVIIKLQSSKDDDATSFVIECNNFLYVFSSIWLIHSS